MSNTITAPGKYILRNGNTVTVDGVTKTMAFSSGAKKSEPAAWNIEGGWLGCIEGDSPFDIIRQA